MDHHDHNPPVDWLKLSIWLVLLGLTLGFWAEVAYRVLNYAGFGG